ncbi:MAG: hypothetical protein LAP85_02565 [Acidobacteriia bacterium]|nr:hypothetical protein [Terriglobia bacterium]
MRFGPVDANLLVYAHVAALPQHDRAREWLDARLNGAAPVGLPWPSLLGFLRLTTNPRIFERPLSITNAWRQVKSWLNCDPVWIPGPTEKHRVSQRFLAAERISMLPLLLVRFSSQPPRPICPVSD